MKDLLRKQPSGVKSWKKFQPREKQLNSKYAKNSAILYHCGVELFSISPLRYLDIKTAVHEAFCSKHKQ